MVQPSPMRDSQKQKQRNDSEVHRLCLPMLTDCHVIRRLQHAKRIRNPAGGGECAWMEGSRCCASYAAKLNTGCASCMWRIVRSAAGGRGGFSVTNVSGAPGGSRCRLLIQ